MDVFQLWIIGKITDFIQLSAWEAGDIHFVVFLDRESTKQFESFDLSKCDLMFLILKKFIFRLKMILVRVWVPKWECQKGNFTSISYRNLPNLTSTQEVEGSFEFFILGYRWCSCGKELTTEAVSSMKWPILKKEKSTS